MQLGTARPVGEPPVPYPPREPVRSRAARAVLRVVAVLLLLSTSAELRWVWSLVAVAAAGWTAYAVWETRRTDLDG